MKHKPILILLTIITISHAFSFESMFKDSSKIHFTYGIELGWISTGRLVLYEIGAPGADVLNYDLTLYTDVGIGLSVFDFYIKGNTKVPFYPYREEFSMCPFSSFFNFSVGYKRNRFDVGVRHLCAHPVLPAIRHEEIPEMVTGGYTEMFIRFGSL